MLVLSSGRAWSCARGRSRDPDGISDPRTRATQSDHLGRILDRIREVLPEFERSTGITVTTLSGSSQGKGRKPSPPS